jgi:hypothetical protein
MECVWSDGDSVCVSAASVTCKGREAGRRRVARGGGGSCVSQCVCEGAANC